MDIKRNQESNIKVKHLSYCNCGSNSISETNRNSRWRLDEHEKWNEKSKSSKDLIKNTGHEFSSTVLIRAPSNCVKIKVILISNEIYS